MFDIIVGDSIGRPSNAQIFACHPSWIFFQRRPSKRSKLLLKEFKCRHASGTSSSCSVGSTNSNSLILISSSIQRTRPHRPIRVELVKDCSQPTYCRAIGT